MSETADNEMIIFVTGYDACERAALAAPGRDAGDLLPGIGVKWRGPRARSLKATAAPKS